MGKAENVGCVWVGDGRSESLRQRCGELGSHRDLTPEQEGSETWRFEIVPHSRPEEIDDHDIAVAGE